MKLLKAFLYFIDYMIAIELGIYEAVFQKVNILLLLSLAPMIIQLQLHQMGLFELHATLSDFYIFLGTILFSTSTFALWISLSLSECLKESNLKSLLRLFKRVMH